MTDLMLVVYDPDTMLPKFTLDAPYADTAKDFYIGKGLSCIEVQRTFIGDKHVVPGPNGDLILAMRPTLPATWDKVEIIADGADTAVLTVAVPEFTVYVDGQLVGVVTDQTFEFAVDTAGAYRIVIDQAPYLPYTEVIAALLP